MHSPTPDARRGRGIPKSFMDDLVGVAWIWDFSVSVSKERNWNHEVSHARGQDESAAVPLA